MSKGIHNNRPIRCSNQQSGML